jgi:hypothetical protein
MVQMTHCRYHFVAEVLMYVRSALFPYALRLQAALRFYESDCTTRHVMSAEKGTPPERAGTSGRMKWN